MYKVAAILDVEKIFMKCEDEVTKVNTRLKLTKGVADAFNFVSMAHC